MDIKRYLTENMPIIYLDETYIRNSHTVSEAWEDEVHHLVISKGQRVIIVHPGGMNVFVPNAYIQFKLQNW